MARIYLIPNDMDPRNIKIRVGETFEWRGHYLGRTSNSIKGYRVRLNTGGFKNFTGLTLDDVVKLINQNQGVENAD